MHFMKMKYIFVGNPTSGGGQVISGNNLSLSKGMAIACVGDKAICPKHNTISKIITGDSDHKIMGKPVARINDLLSCGCKLLPQSSSAIEDDIENYGIKFQLINEISENPLSNQYYKLEICGGNTFEGLTDEYGNTCLLESGKEVKHIILTTYDLSKPMESWD